MFTNVSRPSAVDVLRPFAVGDTFYADTTSTLAKLPIGATNDVLTIAGGVPVWSSAVVVVSLSVVDSGFFVIGSSDPTKRLNFEVDAQTTGDTLTINTGAQTDSRTLTVPVLTANATLAVLEETQTFTGAKTFSAVTTVSNATAATDPTDGALRVTGGVGVGGSIYAAGDLSAGLSPDVRIALSSGGSFGRIVVSSGSFVLTSGATNIMGVSTTNITAAVTTAATASTNGAFVVGDDGTAATCIGMGGGKIYVGTNFAVDLDATAGNTRLMIYDVDNGTLERVSVGAADSGGAGFKVLRIPN